MVNDIPSILWSAMIEVARKTIIPALDDAIQTWKNKAKEVSPVDSWDYVESFDIIPVRLIWNTIVWWLRNDDEKATGVEWGWRKSESSWSKKWWSPIVEYWVGARVFQKADEEVEKDFKNNLSKW